MMNLRDFRIGWRLLVKEPAYSAVVVLGLAVGIAVCFLLLGFVRHSFAYDEQVPERARVFRLIERWHVAALGDGWHPTASLPALATARASGQPVLATTFLLEDLSVRAGTRVRTLAAAVVDPDFATIFAPHVLSGDLHAALTRPDALALTRTTAEQLFGRVDVVGRTLQSDRQAYVVAAVVADQPAATTMPFDALAGNASPVFPASARQRFAQAWGGTPGFMYVKLLPGADPAALLDAVRRAMRQSVFIRRDAADQVAALGGRDLIDYRLEPLADAYLDPDLRFDSTTHGDRTLMLGLAGVALLILLLAATNYVNLATVRLLARQREIAVRKVLGASAGAVARQFLAESVLVCLLATIAGLLLAWLLLPVFSDLVQRTFDRMFSPGAVAVAIVLGALLGVVAGAYPAWSALRVRPTAALASRGASETVRGLWIRRGLTALQFATAIGLSATTLAVAWQTHYASTLDPGFDAAPLLTFFTANGMNDPRMRALRDELVRLPGVEGVAESSNPITFANNITSLRRAGGTALDFNRYAVSPEFFQVYGLTPLAGRLFDPALDRMTDNDRIVLNASAARKLGFADPHSAIGQTLSDVQGAWRVIGVAPDIRHRSAREGEQPSAFFLGEGLKAITVRSHQDPTVLTGAIEAILARRFPNETFDVQRMPAFLVAEFYADDLRLAQLLAASSVIAIAIAAFGIYVLAAYSVQRRAREIVLRKLYGASGAAIGLLVAREFGALVGAGALLGLPFAWLAIARWLAGFTARAPIGAWTLLAALLVAGAVALLATLRHALAALRIRPVLALRE